VCRSNGHTMRDDPAELKWKLIVSQFACSRKRLEGASGFGTKIGMWQNSFCIRLGALFEST